jgi:ATP-dependent Clp protease ATP-binding subunit ClpB
MTSNLGAEYLANAKISPSGKLDNFTKQAVLESIHRFFKPEFINRISATVVFNPLSKRNIRKVVELRLAEVQDRLRDKSVTLHLDDAAKDWLGAAGYSPAYGARPLNRVIQTEVFSYFCEMANGIDPQSAFIDDPPRRNPGWRKCPHHGFQQ